VPGRTNYPPKRPDPAEVRSQYNSLTSGKKSENATAKGGYILVTFPRTVTPYRDSVDGTRDHVTYQVVYAVTLRARSVRCRYLAVASKGW
jgi:hypothetical protein